MKPYFYLFFFIILASCSKNSVDKNCNFLLNVGVNLQLNLNLPQYSQLQFPSNSVYVPHAENSGVIVVFTGVDYFAWDASDPNHIPSSCSILEASGLEATCKCDDGNTYSLVTGQPLRNGNLQCSLRNYRVDVVGSSLIISN